MQLRGRSGRQGDPGSTRYFLSLEDNVFRVFGGDRCAPPALAERRGVRDRAPDWTRPDWTRPDRLALLIPAVLLS